MTNPQVESLLEHDSFLRAMARRLLNDDGAADDVVQEAWLVALRSAKRPDEVPAAWLVGIVRNLVRRARRDHERRARRERAVARSCAVGPTDEACAERALRRRIAEVVVDLPEIYREPLLLRYYDGLSPQAIAERLALPGSTVRTRIQRGLARVRQRLENGHGFSATALLAIASPRPSRGLLRAAGIAAVLAAGALLARTPPPDPLRTAAVARTTSTASLPAHVAPFGMPPPSPAEAAGGVPAGEAAPLLDGIVHLPQGAIERSVRLEIDGTHVADIAGDLPFAVGLPRAGTACVRVTHGESEPLETVVRVPGRMEVSLRRRALVPEEHLVPSRASAAAGAPEGGEAKGASGDADAARRAPAAIPLEGFVRLPRGASAAPVLLEAWRRDGARVKAPVRGGQRFSIGVAALLADPMPEEIRVRASHPDATPREAGVPVLFDPSSGAPALPFLEIDLLSPAFLHGVVELEGTGPAPDVTVAVFGSEGEEIVAAATTREDGTFRVAVDRGAAYYVAAAAPAYAPAGVAVAADGDMALPTLVLRRGLVITGSVRSAGAPAPRATVRASLPSGEGRTLPLGLDGNALLVDAGGVSWRSVSAGTDAGGTFSLGGLSAGTYRVEVEALLDGGLPPYDAVDVAAPGVVEFDAPLARVAILVRGGGGEVPDASVDVRRADGSTMSFRAEGGRTVFLARSGEPLHVAVAAPGYAPEERDLRAATSELIFDLVPDVRFATLVVSLRSADGIDLPAACEFELLPDRGFLSRRKVFVQEGRFLLDELEPGAYSILATPPGNFLPVAARVTLRRGETAPLDLTVRAGGRIVLRILTRGDMPEVWIEGAGDKGFGDGASRWTVSGDTIESGLMAPGRYVLHVLAPGGPRSMPVELKPGETMKLLVPLG